MPICTFIHKTYLNEGGLIQYKQQVMAESMTFILLTFQTKCHYSVITQRDLFVSRNNTNVTYSVLLYVLQQYVPAFLTFGLSVQCSNKQIQPTTTHNNTPLQQYSQQQPTTTIRYNNIANNNQQQHSVTTIQPTTTNNNTPLQQYSQQQPTTTLRYNNIANNNQQQQSVTTLPFTYVDLLQQDYISLQVALGQAFV